MNVSGNVAAQVEAPGRNLVQTSPDTDEAGWAALGLLRFFLATIVFVTHLNQSIPLDSAAQSLVQLGPFSAVLGFFLISGYSIAASIERNPDHFYMRRFARIAPAYLVGMTLALLVPAVEGLHLNVTVGKIDLNDFFLNYVISLFCLQGIALEQIATNGPIWSLSIEIAYYIMAPFFARLSNVILWVLASISLLLYCVHDKFQVDQFYHSVNGWGIIMLLWGWLSGWLIYRSRLSPFTLIAAALIGCFALESFDQDPGQHAIFLYFLVLACLGSRPMLGKLLVNTPVAAKIATYLGDLSYPLYLVHYPILFLIYIQGKTTAPAITSVVCLLAAVATLHLVENPLDRALRSKDRAKPAFAVVGVWCVALIYGAWLVSSRGN